jgi:hypothetical protein
MSDPFHSSKYSIARAKNHIRDLERQMHEFIESQPYTEVVEIDAQRVEQVHKIKLVKPMPIALQGIAADAVNNLRNALDQAIYAITPRKNAFFPIAPDAPHFENAVKGRCKHLPQEIIDLLRGFKPYKGGNSLLWALNELSNTNKHAIIRPVAIASGGIEYWNMVVNDGASVMPPVWDRAKNEMELIRLRPGGKFDANFHFISHIAISDVEFVDGQPADAVLNEFVRIVEGVVMAIEAEARRIGLL